MIFIEKLDYPNEPKWMQITYIGFCLIIVTRRRIKHEAKIIPHGSNSKTKTKVLGGTGQRRELI